MAVTSVDIGSVLVNHIVPAQMSFGPLFLWYDDLCKLAAFCGPGLLRFSAAVRDGGFCGGIHWRFGFTWEGKP